MKPSTIFLRMLRILLLVVTLIGLFLLFGLRHIERHFIFFPQKFPEGYWDTEHLPFQVEDCLFKTNDGLQLHGWFARAQPDSDDLHTTLLFFHGNAGNLSHRVDNIAGLVACGLHVFIFDYRGYGKSEGQPDETGLYRDALAAYAYLETRSDVNLDEVIFFGRSLGGAVALDLATRKVCKKLILESTFTSAQDMADQMFGGFPIHYFIRTRFDSLKKIAGLQVPLLLIHGNQDSIIPFEQGQRLFEAATPPKTLYVIDGADHNNTYVVGGHEYFERLCHFIIQGM